MKKLMLVAALGLVATQAAAQDKLKIGILTTLSGPPAALGVQQRNGFQLALKTLGGKLGGREVGLIFSNILIAMMKPITESGTILISPNAGTSNFAGKECNQNFFVTSYQND